MRRLEFHLRRLFVVQASRPMVLTLGFVRAINGPEMAVYSPFNTNFGFKTALEALQTFACWL
ncbi:MAG: hypothetical protein ACRC1K_21065, partial [Planctomycetia bacterium]